MRAHLTAAATAALLLGLLGCSAAPEETPIEEPATSTEETTEVEPLTAEPVEKEATSGTPEEAFLAEVRPYIDESEQIPDATDDQLLAAANDACAQIATGTDPAETRVIEGEQPDETGMYLDSRRIGLVAARTLCP